MKYEKLFSKGKIGNLELKNRVVMPAIGTSLAAYSGEPSKDMIAYYEERAKGGCGLIITEITRVDEEYGVSTPNQLSVTNPKHVAGLERLVQTVHKYDTKLFVQLHHPGRESHSYLINGKQLIAPSPIPCGVCKEVPREMTTEEVEGMVKKFITGAKIAQKAGVDGVELHGAHGYLINQFLSPYTNKRVDKYGGSFTNRMRFITEIILGIRHICGTQFPVSVRISGDEFVEAGINLDESVKIARYLESIGIDVINVSAGIYETGFTIIEPVALPQGWKQHLAKTIKSYVKIPVIAVNNIKFPETAESFLNEGVMDFAGIGRAQLADPEWTIKAASGREDTIRPCISCLHCIETCESGVKTKCAVNPRMSRELEFSNIEKDMEGKNAVVIGAGPAGLEASRTLALRGFNVTLLEKEDKIGGMVYLATKPPEKDKLNWLIDYYNSELKKLNVAVKLNCEATVESVKAINPDVVFIATGSNPIVPPVEGVNGDNVFTVSDILGEKVELKEEKVVVIGGGMTGCEVAEFLATRGNKVSLVDMLPKFGSDVYPANMVTIMKNLNAHNVSMLTSHKLNKISDKSVSLIKLENNSPVEIEADKVVLSLGITPNKSLESIMRDNFNNVKVIGDASKPGRIAEAVREGFEKVISLTNNMGEIY